MLLPNCVHFRPLSTTSTCIYFRGYFELSRHPLGYCQLLATIIDYSGWHKSSCLLIITTNARYGKPCCCLCQIAHCPPFGLQLITCDNCRRSTSACVYALAYLTLPLSSSNCTHCNKHSVCSQILVRPSLVSISLILNKTPTLLRQDYHLLVLTRVRSYIAMCYSFYRRLQHIAILMYKVKNNMCPTYISTLFKQPAK